MRRPATALDSKHVWHPYTQHGLAGPAREIIRGEGALLFDASGAEIIDAVSSWWVTLHGHCEPSIADAVAAQARTLEQVIFAGFTHEPAALLASELVALAPKGLSRVFFSDDGSTSVEVALKMAAQYWSNRGEQRVLIASLDHAYHGDTFGAMSVSSAGVFTDPFNELLFEVARLPVPGEGDTLAAFDELLERDSHQTAALILEPLLMGAGGMLMYEPAILQGLRERTREHGILLIADEVLTGFGRTGPLFACGKAGVSPDILCLSKGLTGGFLPLGATLATEEVFQAFVSDEREKMLFHGHSFSANPISCAAARASLALLDAECEGRRGRIEAQHRTEIAKLASHSSVADGRVTGTVAAFNLTPRVRKAGTSSKGYLDPVARGLFDYALDRGVLLRPLGDVVYVLPPYCIDATQLARVYEVIREFLEQL